MNKLKKSLRAITANAVYSVLEERRSLQDVLPISLEGQTEQDKAWIHEMLYGVLRNLPLLQFWFKQLVSKPLKPEQRVIEHLIYLGFYQLAFTRVADHAAVAETVGACAELNQGGMKSLVNGVLRNFIRKNTKDIRPDDKRITAGLPKWLYKRLLTAYPEQFDSIAENQKEKPSLWIRTNLSKISSEDYQQKLKDNDIDFETQARKETIKLLSPVAVPNLPGFEEGLFQVQDAAAQKAAYYLEAQPDERILDACCAPGGKTCHILEAQPNLKDCVAVDIEKNRIETTQENLSRLGHSATLLVGDVVDVGSWWDGVQFDRILLDAPCSATGIIRRHPDILWLRKAADIAQLVELQSKILSSCWQILKPGGILLYSTCSILPEENIAQVEQFLQMTNDARLVPLQKNSEATSQQILPGENGMDGFFYAKLQKVAKQ